MRVAHHASVNQGGDSAWLLSGQYFRGYDQYIRAIHMAAYEARPDLMRLLLTAGASVDAPDRKGRSPVQCVLAPTFFDGQSLIGKPSKTTARQRLTLQVSTTTLHGLHACPYSWLQCILLFVLGSPCFALQNMRFMCLLFRLHLHSSHKFNPHAACFVSPILSKFVAQLRVGLHDAPGLACDHLDVCMHDA